MKEGEKMKQWKTPIIPDPASRHGRVSRKQLDGGTAAVRGSHDHSLWAWERETTIQGD